MVEKQVINTQCQAVPGKGLWENIVELFHKKYVLYPISLISFLLIWDILVVTEIAKFMPRPIDVFRNLIEMTYKPLAGKTLFQHIWCSFKRVIIAFFIAALIGIPTGVLMGFNRYANAIIKPIFEIFKPMPPIAWISLSILWFGIGETSKIFIIIIGAIVPLIINSYNGIRLVDPELYDAARILGANYWQEHIQVTFPACFPAIFAGLQIALSMAWTCVLAAELVGAREGMGFIIVMGMNLGRPAMIIAGMLVIAIIAFLSSVLINLLERWLCPWKRGLEE